MMRAIIVDDELPAISEIRFLLEKFDHIKVIGEGYDGEEALILVEKLKPDVIFLDIHMSNLDGISTAYNLIQMKPSPMLVFATGYDEYAVKAFELNAVDYILKPFHEDRMALTVEKLVKAYQRADGDVEEHTLKALDSIVNMKLNDKMAVWDREKIKIIEYDEILYITVDGRQSMIFTGNGTFTLYMNLKELELKLPSNKFLRTHRSYIVNLDNIDEIKMWFNNTFVIHLKNCKEEIPVSRTYMREFRNSIGL